MLFVFFLFACLNAADSDSFDKAIQPFLDEHCVRCHDDKKQKGKFRLDTLSRDFANGPDSELWHEVIGRINAGEMPPEDEPQPEIETISSVVDWIANQIREGEAYRKAKRTPVSHYRLSRDEYQAAIYDLLGVVYNASDPGQLSEDPDWHGFRRIGSELSLAPSHVEKYLRAASVVLDEVFPDKAPETIKTYKNGAQMNWQISRSIDELEEAGIADKVRIVLWPQEEINGTAAGPRKIPETGLYRVKIKVSGLQPPGGPPPHLLFYSRTNDRILHQQDVVTKEDEPITIDFETHLDAGLKYYILENDVPGPHNKGRAGRASKFPFISTKDPRSRAPWQRKLTDDEGNAIFPLLLIDSVEWEGPIVSPQAVKLRQTYLPPEDATPEEVGELLLKFATRAWRKTLSREEIADYISLYKTELAAGASTLDAYKAALTAILASQRFYYISEGTPGERRYEIDDFEMASRLSFFLWNSIPDEPLLQAAASGDLKNPAPLRQQIERMFSDPKIERFLESFPTQWLQLHKVGMFPPDPKLYPDYDGWLEDSMKKETTSFFSEVFRKNMSIGEFLDSDWTMLNPRLARHYGIPVEPKDEFQRVALLPGHQRGGILTHGSVLSLSSDGTRHRPVHRGVWVSESILGKVPAPPPANVDPIEPTPSTEQKATVRMKLAAHVSDKSCASCHRKIDPLGFAFDHFDAIGRYRTIEVVEDGKGANPPVDASGTMHDGTAFADHNEFKKILSRELDQFGYAITEKLATYALRRAMTVDDHDDIEKISNAVTEKNYPLRDLVTELVLSELFQAR